MNEDKAYIGGWTRTGWAVVHVHGLTKEVRPICVIHDEKVKFQTDNSPLYLFRSRSHARAEKREAEQVMPGNDFRVVRIIQRTVARAE